MTGIKTIVSIDEFAEHKGMSYEQYYVTRPSLPVLCYFVRFINNTGGYKDMGYNMNAFISGKENLTDIYAQVERGAEKEEYRYRMGDVWSDANKLIRISYEDNSIRDEKLYMYSDTERNHRSGMGISSDINSCSLYNHNAVYMVNNESATLNPVFFILILQ